MTYTKHVEVYQYTETIIKYNGTEIAREPNHDEMWYDTHSVEEITQDEAEEYL